MTEGWHKDDYLTLFDAIEAERLAAAYSLPRLLPGYRLIGLKSWDDFIVADPSGAMFTVPTVPLVAEHLTPFSLPSPLTLRGDERLTGRIKWYIKPIAFGGSPELGENVAWIDLQQHAGAVVWFNQMYRAMVGGDRA